MLLTPKLRRQGQKLIIWCVGCQLRHTFDLEGGARWNGNIDKPTFSPPQRVVPRRSALCHFVVQQGRIEYLPGTTHAFARQILPLADFPGT